MTTSKFLAPIAVVLCCALPLFADSSDELSWGAKLDDTVRVVSDNQRVLAQLQLDRVTMSGEGFHDDGAVIAVYEPVSEQFWWMYQRWTAPVELSDIKAYFLKEFCIGFDGTTAVGFAAAGPLLQLRAIPDKFPSLEAGLANVRAQFGYLARPMSRGTRLFKDLNLSSVLGEYFKPQGPTEIGGPAGHGLIIKSVKKVKDGWEVELGLELVAGIQRSETRVIRIDESLSNATLVSRDQQR